MNKKSMLVMVGFSLLVLPMASFAALDPAVGAAFDGMQSNFDALMAKAWPILGAVTTALILVGLFKTIAYRIFS